MARVNHKLVKQRLNEKRSKITDRQFFTSRLLAGHFEDIAAAQTRRYSYNRRVHVNLIWNPKMDFTAVTDNECICINCGHPTVTCIKGRENRYQTVCGLFAHELGHVLYTDFLISQTYHNYMDAYKWYPNPPTLKNSLYAANAKDIWDYAKDSGDNLKLLNKTAHEIANVLEDGYVENRMLINFPGTLGYGLEELRDFQYNNMSTVTQLIECEDSGSIHIFQSILQIILSYAKFGEIKYGEEPLSDLRIQTAFELLSDIDKAVMTHSAKERFDVVNTILPVVRLDRVFRQESGSRIASNAKLIRHGKSALEYGEDFSFINSPSIAESAEKITQLYLQEVHRYGVDNVALLTPYRQKSETGVNALNERIRDIINPKAPGKNEVSYGKRLFREGDKIMQVKNLEDINNGDIGYITHIINSGGETTVCVDFGDGRKKEYDSGQLDILDLGYASTIHKAQGAEYKSVIINVQCAHYIMLTRPLVYTAITRGKDRVTLIGEKRALGIAINKTDTEKRGTCLSKRINELLY